MHDMNTGASHTCGPVRSAENDTRDYEWDNHQDVEREENAKDDLGPVIQCPDAEDHHHCSHHGHSPHAKRTTQRRTICGTNENKHRPWTENTEYFALEVLLNRVKLSSIERTCSQLFR
jgi:hypothetical protein